MIIGPIRKNFINKLRNSDNTSKQSFEYQNIKKIGCVIDCEKVTDYSYILGELSKLNNTKINVKAIGFVKKVDKERVYELPVFDDTGVGMFANVKSAALKEFVAEEYDVLINYFTDNSDPLICASAIAKATVKVGFPNVDAKCNDLIINCAIEEVGMFLKLLKNYLKVIKK